MTQKYDLEKPNLKGIKDNFFGFQSQKEQKPKSTLWFNCLVPDAYLMSF